MMFEGEEWRCHQNPKSFPGCRAACVLPRPCLSRMRNNKNNEFVIVSVLVAKRARVRLGEMVLLFAFAISLWKSPEGKSISYQVWTECQDHVPQTLGGLKRSRILLRLNLQDLMPLRAFHADQQWPLDLGHEKKKSNSYVSHSKPIASQLWEIATADFGCVELDPADGARSTFPVVICRQWE